MAEDVDGAGRAEAAPRVAAGGGDFDPVAPHANGLMSQLAKEAAFDDDVDRPLAKALDDGAHPTQIAQPFFADVGHQYDVGGVGQGALHQRAGQHQQPGQPGRVVADARPIEQRPLAPCRQVGRGREDGVQMGRDDQRRPAGVAPRQPGEDVVQRVALDVGHARGAELRRHVLGPARLVEGWRGNLLDGHDLGHDVVQPRAVAGQRGADGWLLGKVGDVGH